MAYTKKYICQKLQNSNVFTWGVYRKKSWPFYHTGILLKFDDQVCFSLDFETTKTGVGILECVRSCCGKVKINDAPKEDSYDYFGDCQCINTTLYLCERFAWSYIKILIASPSAHYSLAGSNCREHVIQAVRSVREKGNCITDICDSTLAKLKEIKDDDDALIKNVELVLILLISILCLWLILLRR